MLPHIFNSPSELAPALGQTFGPTEWVAIEQDRINKFADATEDHQWIHVDVEKAKSGPFGAPIAHGLMTLAMVQHLSAPMLQVEGIAMIVNYGLNKVRFPSPVRVGARVRAQLVLLDVEPVAGGGAWRATISVTVEIEGGARPAVAAEILLHMTG